ncbi:VOC family protein [Cryptosporangium sp. NPDC048952]|uniref:VOC family protein n=1 Tax=Cryptosporangium sp. NPDC048952 TaxID=3363961 RepID=UPI003717DDC6
MTGVGRLEVIAFDAPDIGKIASFYEELAGWRIVRTDDDWIAMRTPEDKEVAFQRAADHVPPQWPGQERPQQFHLDLLVDGYEQAAQRAVELGATHLADGATWITLADPAGHPFDICQRDGVGPAMDLYAVTIDAPDASALARFYADLTGMEVTYDGEYGAQITGVGYRGIESNLMFQPVSAFTPPQWPDPGHPQQAHLDIAVENVADSEAKVVELGATLLNRDPNGFTVFADPVGHPFCLTAP